MPLSHLTKLYGVNDAAVYKMNTDVAGSAPTYGTKTDVPGVKQLDAQLATNTKTLRGDNALLAADSVLDQIKGKVTFAKVGFDVWAALVSDTTTDSGTTPNQKSVFTIAQADLPNFHKIEAQSKQVDFVGGDLHQIYWKCMPGNIAAGYNEEDYMIQSYEFIAVPILGTISSPTTTANVWASFVANETSVAIT